MKHDVRQNLGLSAFGMDHSTSQGAGNFSGTILVRLVLLTSLTFSSFKNRILYGDIHEHVSRVARKMNEAEPKLR